MKLDTRIAALTTTSLSDIDSYREACAAAASDDQVFSIFRSLSAYRQILEHVSEELGAAYASAIGSCAPELLDSMYAFARNDLYGSPERFRYPGLGLISPTTLRYVHVVARLRQLFGRNLRGKGIVEVGGGYGGQARILHHLGAQYTIVDLPEACALAKRYLFAFGIDNVDFVSAFNETAQDHGDIFLSNYALTECTPAVVASYAVRFARNCAHGYITGNAQRELLAELLVDKNPQFEPETPVPSEFSDNFICTW